MYTGKGRLIASIAMLPVVDLELICTRDVNRNISIDFAHSGWGIPSVPPVLHLHS